MNDRIPSSSVSGTRALGATAAEPQLLAQAVADRLRDLIVQGELAPSVRLNERLLCAELGISRTPLREALKSLASEGLVSLQPNRGAIVTPLTVSGIKEIFQVLGSLESLAGELVCECATEADIAELRAMHYQMVAHYARRELADYFRFNQAIHMRLVEASGNATLAQTYRQLNAHVRRARYMANLSEERWAKAVREHEEMMDALVARDAATLKRLLREHLGAKMIAVLAALDAHASED